MLSATKVEYLWDATEGKVSDAGDKYTMKLGIGSQENRCNTGKYERQSYRSGLPVYHDYSGDQCCKQRKRRGNL